MLENMDICQYISELAVKSMLFEVSATPKPGLVDRHNAGAHKDMNFYTFMESCAALGHTFYRCGQIGHEFQGETLKELMNALRPVGVEAEKRMFKATKGINTHKGLIFSLGIIAAAAGLQYRETQRLPLDIDELCNKIKEMTRGIVERELAVRKTDDSLTYGEKLYQRYGIKGIRGEVESGFHTVRTHALPILQQLISRDQDINDALVQVLLHLMVVTEDSNVLGRHDWETLEYVKSSARRVLAIGGIFSEEGRKKIIEMDRDFIRRNISPGGSADLLAVALMLYFLS